MTSQRGTGRNQIVLDRFGFLFLNERQTPEEECGAFSGICLEGRKNMRLENNQQFPTIVAKRVGGSEMTIPADLAGSWSVVLFYRGDW